MDQKTPFIEMNPDQVVSLLGYIDSSQEEEVKQAIFCRLGQHCFVLNRTREWVLGYRGDVQKFLDEVNLEKKSPHWETLEFNQDKTILYLTGKKVSRCACSFGASETPPKSLCLYCCRTFQEALFGTLLQRKVQVEITESSILGGERCSTAIHLV